MSMWVVRNGKGKIEGAAFVYQTGFEEELPDNDPELRAFMDNTLPQPPAGVDNTKALIERRARALDRVGTTEAQLAAINLRMGV